MANNLVDYEVSDLCLGKPSLRSLSISSTISEALYELKQSEDNYLSVWNCIAHHHHHHIRNQSNLSNNKITFENCQCVGKISMVDIICFLCKEENLDSPSALKSPISVLISMDSGLVQHVEPHTSLVEAIDLVLEGAQNLIIPIQNNFNNRKKQQHKSSFRTSHEFCWLTQEDIIRFLLSSIGVFSPLPAYLIESLNFITTECLAIGYHEPALSAIDAISLALKQQTSVAVVDNEGKLIGEISPFTLARCEETVAAAIRTLSSGDLMAYIDCGGPPEDIIRLVKSRLKSGNLDGVLSLMEELNLYISSSFSCSSSNEELSSSSSSPTAPFRRSSRHDRSRSYSARMISPE